MIAAAAENNAIGKDNDLLWHLPLDFNHFKTLTSGHTIIMGRKTFESFPKPLPNRTHIIITRQPNYKAPEGCIVVPSLEKAMELCPANEEAFVIGGGEIYRAALASGMVSEMLITHVSDTFGADTFFPEWNTAEWDVEHIATHEQDERHAAAFKISRYTQKKTL